ncbi:MAG: sodium/solute symporter [Verrucomicrobia bacterium]|nr:sodium/solute symporter [Verrucomicrobiota bacterium]
MGASGFKILPGDVAIFVLFVITVVTVGLIKSRDEKSSEDYFLAGRGLRWWLIGFSLIAANISTEQFVGMSGNAAQHVGLAIASYEWLAAVTLVVVAFGFLPYFLRAGIYTMPEFLEYRYNSAARLIMAAATILIYLLLLASVTYSGALTIKTLAGKAGHPVSLAAGSLVIGLIAMIYVTAGGLKACAWADLIQGSALILGGGVIMYFAFQKLGAASEASAILSVKTGAVAVKELAPDAGSISRFLELNRARLNMFLPASDPILPWTALLFGLWIPNFYYWGLNQYITQRTLGSASLAQGQRGIVFAAFMKLLVPFVIVVPGMIAFNLYSRQMRLEAAADTAKALAYYVKANPETRHVKVVESPTPEQIRNWGTNAYMIAVFPEEAAIEGLQVENPFVLPIAKDAFEALQPSPYLVFASPEDLSWKHVNPELAKEVEAYNKRVEERAQADGKETVTEKLIAYKYDTALAQLLGHVLPQGVGLVGFVVAALLGAVVSSLAAMLNAGSTILAMDIVKKYLAPNASQKTIVFIGRAAVVGFAIVAVVVAPLLGNPNIRGGIFTIIQESQGFISPGILAVFVFGLVVRTGPPSCGPAGLVTNMIAYGALMFLAPNLQFLNRMAVCFVLCVAVMALITLLRPLPKPIEFKRQGVVALESSRTAKIAGIGVVLLTVLLYIVFSPLVIAR